MVFIRAYKVETFAENAETSLKENHWHCTAFPKVLNTSNTLLSNKETPFWSKRNTCRIQNKVWKLFYSFGSHCHCKFTHIVRSDMHVLNRAHSTYCSCMCHVTLLEHCDTLQNNSGKFEEIFGKSLQMQHPYSHACLWISCILSIDWNWNMFTSILQVSKLTLIKWKLSEKEHMPCRQQRWF